MAAGLELASCPPLGATILAEQQVAIDSGQIFTLPIHVTDAYSSQVTAGPGSDWVASFASPLGLVGAGGQLSGDARGQLERGQLLLSGLSLAAPPGVELPMLLAATPLSGNRQMVSRLG